VNPGVARDRDELKAIARRAMISRGLLPEFSEAAMAEAAAIQGPATERDPSIRDLRSLLWASIDNDDSRDLDQLSVAESLPGGATKLLVAIADVDSLVACDTPVDQHAAHNTTSVYTGAQIFPMLPERLSTDLTSLNEDEDRHAIGIEYVVDEDGTLGASDVYDAVVRNHAKLAYPGVGAWLEGHGPMPPKIAEVNGLEANLRLQDLAAQALKSRRHQMGALTLKTIEARPIFEEETLRDLAEQQVNRATELIEDLMVASNGVVARFLADHGLSSLRRVVRMPEKWDRIVDLAAQHGSRLPHDPDALALEEWLLRERAEDAQRFPDLSLSVIKLLGRGEYVVERPGEIAAGHFGLAVQDYTHSTAPNRRFADLVTQRLVKTLVDGDGARYSDDELETIARTCTEKEDAARKVERAMTKRIAAVAMGGRIGETFDAIVTGESRKGTFVRIFKPHVDGMLVKGAEGVDVGDRLTVRLVNVDEQRGFIDFAAIRTQ
jgi:exoribonuclease-2